MKDIKKVDLYDVPFTNYGTNVVEKYFSKEETSRLLEMVKSLAA